MTVNAYTGETSSQTNEYPELEEKFDEDPARFLESNELLATARIAGIRDADLLTAYREVAEEITTGQYRTEILEAIAERERELTDAEPGPTPDTDPEPVAATDGGESIDSDKGGDSLEPPAESGTLSEAPTGSAAATPAIHPDAFGLEAGEVAVVDRGDATEYIWPATADADDPYLLRTFDGDDERTAEPIPLSKDEMKTRLGVETETHDAAAIDKRPPAGAATGGDQQ